MRSLLGLALIAGCGEPALCTRDVAVALDVAHLVRADLDPIAAGVQTTVAAVTSLAVGDRVMLTVSDDTSTVVSTTEATVDAAGVASFGLVTVPPPTAQLRASASTLCGAAEATVALEVLAGARCELAFATVPLDIPRYAPLGVLDRATDAEPATPGEQAVLAITGRVGASVDIRQRSTLGEETMGTIVLASPTEPHAVTVREGATSLYAICQQLSSRLTSPAISAFVDSRAPQCAIAAPNPLLVRPDGTISIGGHSDDPDTEGELATLTVTPTGGAPIDAHPTPMMSGQTSGTVAIPPGTTAADITFATQDHARNPCAMTAHYAVD